MVVGNFNVFRAIVGPFKANTPPLVDADAVLAFAVAAQGFKPVTRQNGQDIEVYRGVQDFEASFSLPAESLKFFDEIAIGKSLGFLVPIALDHYLY